jgi:hypothetical protein
MLRKRSMRRYIAIDPSHYRGALFVVLILGTLAWLTQPAWVAAQQRNQSAGPIAAEFPSQYFPENLPGASLAAHFPTAWTTYASSAGRNAVFSLPENAPAALRTGVNWRFAGAGAMPLDGPPLNDSVITTAYGVGMPVSLSVVEGMAYVGSDNG